MAEDETVECLIRDISHYIYMIPRDQTDSILGTGHKNLKMPFLITIFDWSWPSHTNVKCPEYLSLEYAFLANMICYRRELSRGKDIYKLPLLCSSRL